MKQHCQMGAKLQEGDDCPVMCMARTIALTHHEKWDGSGYPYGLRGAEIPLEGQIVAVADVFDALTSQRPYKKAWSIRAATAYIEEQAGQHFDPVVVTGFLRQRDEFLAIREQYGD